MLEFSRNLLVGCSLLIVAACAGADDASIEAEADTVEMLADVAMEGIAEEAIQDEEAILEPEVSEQASN